MKEFSYLVEKIKQANIDHSPFEHVYIENFLSDYHFDLLVKSPCINIPRTNNTRDLINTLLELNYTNIKFPGCSTDVESYIKDFEKGFEGLHSSVVESYGLAFRLEKSNHPEIDSLVSFLNSLPFHECLRQKFSLSEKTAINTGIQKYLSGYEISPHPDNRNKALTYLVNINPSSESEQMDIHTHLLSFKHERDYVRLFWKNNPDKERGWVPWDWCESKKLLSENNSLIMFSPSNDTLHGVKLNYDHCSFQRTQLYGNLWYKTNKKYEMVEYNNIVQRQPWLM